MLTVTAREKASIYVGARLETWSGLHSGETRRTRAGRLGMEYLIYFGYSTFGCLATLMKIYEWYALIKVSVS